MGGISQDEILLPQMLKKKAYVSKIVGKWWVPFDFSLVNSKLGGGWVVGTEECSAQEMLSKSAGFRLEKYYDVPWWLITNWTECSWVLSCQKCWSLLFRVCTLMQPTCMFSPLEIEQIFFRLNLEYFLHVCQQDCFPFLCLHFLNPRINRKTSQTVKSTFPDEMSISCNIQYEE